MSAPEREDDMGISKLHQYLVYLIGPDRENEAQVATTVHRAVEKLCEASGLTMDGFLNLYGIRGEYRRKAMAVKARRIPDIGCLAQCLRKMKMPAGMLVDFEHWFVPWDSWVPNAPVLAVLGHRDVPVSSSLRGICSRVMGERDSEALARLRDVLRERAEVVIVGHRESVSLDLDRVGAEARLDKYCKDNKGGAVIVIGSPFRNPLADPIARRIMEGAPAAELPARFRWHFPAQKSDHYLIEPGVCEPPEAGIRLRGHGKTTFRRTTDEMIMSDARAKGELGPKETLGPYEDAGILMMNVNLDPMLILCAGHGGCATVASVLGLGETMYVEHCLESIHDGLVLGQLFQPVVVTLNKPSLAPIDDFGFDNRYDNGWRFPFAEK